MQRSLALDDEATHAPWIDHADSAPLQVQIQIQRNLSDPGREPARAGGRFDMSTLDRRQLLHKAGLALVATQLGIACAPLAQARTGSSAASVTGTTALSSFGPLK